MLGHNPCHINQARFPGHPCLYNRSLIKNMLLNDDTPQAESTWLWVRPAFAAGFSLRMKGPSSGFPMISSIFITLWCAGEPHREIIPALAPHRAHDTARPSQLVLHRQASNTKRTIMAKHSRLREALCKLCKKLNVT